MAFFVSCVRHLSLEVPWPAFAAVKICRYLSSKGVPFSWTARYGSLKRWSSPFLDTFTMFQKFRTSWMKSAVPSHPFSIFKAATVFSLKTLRTCWTFCSWRRDGYTEERVKVVVFNMWSFSFSYSLITWSKEAVWPLIARVLPVIFSVIQLFRMHFSMWTVSKRRNQTRDGTRDGH